MDTKIFPVTVEGRAALDAELKHLLSVERPAVIQAIDVARAHGDLKENAEYAAAKEKQSFIEGRIQHINSLAGAQVIDPSTLNYPHEVFGATSPNTKSVLDPRLPEPSSARRRATKLK
jgi:transcription elongation factor GreA